MGDENMYVYASLSSLLLTNTPQLPKTSRNGSVCLQLLLPFLFTHIVCLCPPLSLPHKAKEKEKEKKKKKKREEEEIEECVWLPTGPPFPLSPYL